MTTSKDFKWLLTLSGLLLAVLVDTASAAQASAPIIVQDDSHRFEVNVDAKSGRVDVNTLKAPKGSPRNLSIRLFRDDPAGTAVDLRALRPVAVQGRQLPKFSGELSPNAGSFVGVELRFETSLKGLTVLRSMPRLPDTKGNK